jgi:uncharacterized protein
MKVVITGGSGLIGRALAAELVRLGDEVVVLSRSPGRAARRLPAGAEVMAWDPSAGAAPLARLLDGADAVINLAGESVGRWPWTRAVRSAIRGSRMQATQALVDAMGILPAERRPTVLVSGSGTHMYEDLDAEPATESSPTTDDNFLASVCLDWEQAALRARELGTRVVVLRTSLVIGRRAPALERLLLPFRLFGGGPLGSGRQWVSWVALDDAVGLIVHALRAWDVGGPLNVAGPEPVRQAEFARIAGSVLRRPAWLRTPAWLIRLALGDQATLAIGSRRLVPEAALRSGYEFRVTSLEQALRQAAG